MKSHKAENARVLPEGSKAIDAWQLGVLHGECKRLKGKEIIEVSQRNGLERLLAARITTITATIVQQPLLLKPNLLLLLLPLLQQER